MSSGDGRTRVISSDVSQWQGRTVLVKAALDPHQPPVAVRGSIEVVETTQGPVVTVVLEYPQMFQSSAHRRTLWLSDEDVEALRASERNGAFELTLPEAG